MQQELSFSQSGPALRSISPFLEMGAYESLWSNPKTTFKSLSCKFAGHPDKFPSDFVSADEALECAETVKRKFDAAGIDKFGVRVQGEMEYLDKFRDVAHPVKLFYFRGWWDLASSRSIAVIGTRNPTPEGLSRARQLVKELVRNNFTVVSGLAAGIDTMAHKTAIEEGGRTIAVIGTPLSHTYPRENAQLQQCIANNFLVISQVPLKRYESQDYRCNRAFFPARNITMSALAEATVIVEAADKSGTLLQARAALNQNRKLFVLDSCFRNLRISWPRKLAEKGARRVKSFDDIAKLLSC